MTRKQLEVRARALVCSSDYWDLVNEIENVSDEELQQIIANPCYIHQSEGHDCEGNDLPERAYGLGYMQGRGAA